MEPRLQAADLGFFSALAMAGSLSSAAREMRITAAAVSKRLSQMEARLGVPLLNRTTRRMSLTVEGETMLRHARSILAEMADLEEQLGASRSTPSGLLRVNATLGFGRSHIGPLISRFVQQYPQVDVQLQLSVDPPSLSDDAFDVCIRFGPPPDARVIARKIASNQRLLCASPAYIARHGEPKTTAELARHNFISIRQGDEAYGVIKLTRGRTGKTETLKTRGNLTTNDGSIAVQWALDGHGILMRAEWDIRDHLAQGQLLQLLPQCHTPDADIYAVYPAQHKSAARVRAFVDFVAEAFRPAKP
jgi:DNA-binding transcriptional LysR family regulator